MVDILIATFNGGKYLREQIESILNQSYKDYKIIIRDDGSSDDTVEIINSYIVKYPGIISMVSDNCKCGSACSNFMQLLKYTTADYIMFSDQDDYWLPSKVQHTLDMMLQIEREIGSERPILVYGKYKPVDSNLMELHINEKHRQEATHNHHFSNLLVQNCVNGCLMMVNRTLADAMGNYNNSILMHDWWAALIAAGGGSIGFVNEVMMLYRQHDNNVVGSVNTKSISYIINKVFDSKTKESSTSYLNQAKLLIERNYDDLSENNKVVLKEFINLFDRPKIIRMFKILNGHYLKSDFVRIVGQLWYI